MRVKQYSERSERLHRTLVHRTPDTMHAVVYSVKSIPVTTNLFGVRCPNNGCVHYYSERSERKDASESV